MVLLDQNITRENLGDLYDLHISISKTSARDVYCDAYTLDNAKCASLFYFDGSLDIGNGFMTDIVNIDLSQNGKTLQVGELVRCHLFDNNKPVIKYGIVYANEKRHFGGGGLIKEV